ncbi:permease prefix domain 1-containing protein [Micromonospora sp. NBC_01796]|uniref:permease prefix domain 1-containing protein n=1 Tax=Micromonospora sp. NBC_01796 TaxID=2975987 RepID=UPI002DD92A53|nr:permease prefix domain 1-containing protein [Micromonospora sp. NBC_01796]WSA89228.1 permease prefix domain 1-containing protein [Micromonospora sp. NBC_01796]
MSTCEAPIDHYLRLLDERLRGPASRKRDLLTEARDSLWDATEAYRDSGLEAVAAQRRAVAEFGTPDQLAPAYQAELTAGQGRRLALVVALVPVAMLTADLMWWQPPATTPSAPSGFLLMVRALDWASYAAGALALVTLLLLGPASRRWHLAPRTVVRPLALVALVVGGLIWALGAFAGVNATLESPAALTWPPMIAAWIMLNATFGLLTWMTVRVIAATGPRPVTA